MTPALRAQFEALQRSRDGSKENCPETESIHDEVEHLLRAQADIEQSADMAAIDHHWGKLVQWLGVWHVGAKGLPPIKTADREGALEAAIKEIQAMEPVVDAISERIAFTSEQGHQGVRARMERMEQIMAKMSRVIERMPAVFSQIKEPK